MTNRKPHATFRKSLIVGGLLVASGAASAQQLVLEEVIVTAQKREESLMDVPIAVSAMTGDKINDTGITTLEELTLYMPNVNINQGQNTPNLFIRGIGSGTNAGFEQSVGMYIDGIYSGRGRLATVPLTMDVARVEVLKGPQGILFGKNTIGGAINITTARPTFDLDSYVEALYEPEHGEQMYTGVLSGGLTDNLAARLAVRYDSFDGWWDNEQLNEEGPERDNLYVRASALWEPSENLEILAKAEYGDFEAEAKPLVIYKSDQPLNFQGNEVFPVIDDIDKGAHDISDSDDSRTDVYALTINYHMDFATFTSISAYSAYEFDGVRNSDFSIQPGLNRTVGEEYEQLSQELRLVSPGGETIDWIAGFYYQESELDITKSNTSLDFLLSGPLSVPPLIGTLPPTPSIFDQDSDSWAIFGQATWNFSDRWRATLGLRYNEETKDLDKQTFAQGLGARGVALGLPDLVVFANAEGALIRDLRSHNFRGLEREEDKTTWSANLQWDATDDMMVYASASTGFKGGGFDEAYSSEGLVVRTGNLLTGEPDGGILPGADPSVLEFDEETVLAYELGAKMSLAQGAAELNVAVFRMEYEDLQVSSLEGDVFRVSNAGESISQGVEIDGRWLLTERLTVGGALAYLDAYYDKFDTATCTIPQVSDPANNPGCLRQDGSNIEAPGEAGAQDLKDKTLTFSPEWTANLNLEYIYPIGDSLELRTNVDVNYSDEYYSALDLDPNTKHDSYTRWNARIALASVDDTWSVALVGKNLTDEETQVWRNDATLTASNSYFAVPERPRSIAIQGRYRF